MPSRAVRAKDALEAHFGFLTSRLTGEGNAIPANLPTTAEWDRLRDLARALLKAKRQKVGSGPHFVRVELRGDRGEVISFVRVEGGLEWAELQRLKRVCRDLNFLEGFKTFIDVLKKSAGPFARLKGHYWDELQKRNRLGPNLCGVRAKLVDWLINRARACPDFDVRKGYDQGLPRYDQLRRTKLKNYGFHERSPADWREIGRMISECFGWQAAEDDEPQVAGYGLMLRLFEEYRTWLRSESVEHARRDTALGIIFALGHTSRKPSDYSLETEVQKLSVTPLDLPSLHLGHMIEGHQLKHGGVPTANDRKAAGRLETDRRRKRDRGTTARMVSHEWPQRAKEILGVAKNESFTSEKAFRPNRGTADTGPG